MSEHLSTGIVERFQRQDLNPGDKRQIYDHAAECDRCCARIVDSRGGEGVVLQSLLEQLLPDNLDEPFHLEFEVIEGYVDDTLDRIDRETAETHLEVCAECFAEVVDFRESLATMRAASLSPSRSAEKSFFQGSARTFPNVFGLLYPLRVPAIIAIVALTIVAAVVVWRMRSSDQQARQKGDGPNNEGIAQQSSPMPLQPSPLPAVTGPGVHSPLAGTKSLKKPGGSESAANTGSPAIVLKDGTNRITLDDVGNLTGLSGVSEENRQAVKDVILAAAIKKPEVLTDLTGREGVLRGNSGGETIKLLYPGNTVIVEDRPLFKWSPLKDATGYRVSVGDSNLHGAAKSEELPPTTTEWRPMTPLKRGMVYSWIVTAVNDGVEIRRASSEPEMKFKVLDAEKMSELEDLKTRSQSRLALGIFYAREGMIIEAEREFEMLVQQNPRSSVAMKLLKEIQSWRKH